ncbi:MAG: hypothetical protein J2P30_05965 [Actinobacteria bacterium]|nr:hypothetical protein [Actinomycetota bacterium]
MSMTHRTTLAVTALARAAATNSAADLQGTGTTIVQVSGSAGTGTRITSQGALSTPLGLILVPSGDVLTTWATR